MFLKLTFVRFNFCDLMANINCDKLKSRISKCSYLSYHETTWNSKILGNISLNHLRTISNLSGATICSLSIEKFPITRFLIRHSKICDGQRIEDRNWKSSLLVSLMTRCKQIRFLMASYSIVCISTLRGLRFPFLFNLIVLPQKRT